MSIIRTPRLRCPGPTFTPTSPPRLWPDLSVQDQTQIVQVIAGLLRRQLSLPPLKSEESRHADGVERS